MTQKSHSQAYAQRKPELKKTRVPLFIAGLFTIARTWKQPRYTLTDEWIKKLWYIYTVEYYSAIKGKAFKSVLMRWMNPQSIKQSEVSQKEKDITHICGIQKDDTDYHLFARQQWRNREQTSGRGEERVRCMERVTRKLTLPYAKQIVNGNLLYDSNRGSVTIQKGEIWRKMGGSYKRVGTSVHLWLIHVDV